MFASGQFVKTTVPIVGEQSLYALSLDKDSVHKVVSNYIKMMC